MQAVGTSEMSLQFYQTTQYHIPEDSNLIVHCCENFKSHQNSFLVFMYASMSIKIITKHLAMFYSSSQDGVSGSGYANVYPNISTKEKNKIITITINFKLYWNCSMLMDKTIAFNQPDITFMNKKTKNTFLIDIAVPNTHNLAKTITDKQNKYQELANEICAVWNQKAGTSDPDSNIIYGSNSKVTITKSNKT